MSWFSRVLNYVIPRIKEVQRIAGITYLTRYHLSPNFLPIRLMLHNICLPDSDEYPHDHPWWFVTFVVSGGYIEQVMRPDGTFYWKKLRRFAIRYRPATYTHRIMRVEPNTWTLVLAGPRGREWGFWVSPTRWIQADKYLKGQR